jgi:hypothetical protein
VIEGKNGLADALTSPGLFGTWPVVDYCNGYSSLVLVKNLITEDRADIHQEIRQLIMEQLTNRCQ